MTISLWELGLYAVGLAVLWVTPGPVWVALLARGMSGGFQAAWPLAVGVTIGDALWPLVAIYGLTWIVERFASFMLVLHVIAALTFVTFGLLLIRHADKGITADSRLTRPGKGLEQIARQRHQRAGVASGHTSVGAAVLELMNGHAHRRVALATQGDLDRVVHRHHFGGQHRRAAGPALCRGQRLGRANKQQLGLRVLDEKGAAGRQDDRRAVVAAHAVDGDAHDRQRGPARGVQGVSSHGNQATRRPKAAAADTLRRRPWSSGPCGHGRSRLG